ncbi:MAG: TldD/PmbA family protein [Planctomycetota bacterium]|jgi:PmbA protein
MREEEASSLANRALDTARAFGADEAEACVDRVRFSDVRTHMGKPERVRTSESFGIGVRVFVGGRTGFFCTCIPEEVEEGVGNLTRGVRQADPDPQNGLPDPPKTPFPELEVFDPKLARLGTAEKIDILTQLETEALETDPRLISRYFTFQDTVEERLLQNTRGLSARCKTTFYVITGLTGVKDERRGTRGFFFRAGRYLGDLTGLGGGAAQRAIRAFGGKPFPPRKCTVVYDSLLASMLIGKISFALLGSLDVRGETFLAGKTGERIAPASVTLVDDLALPKGPMTRPFDGEGVAPQRTVVVEKGILKTFLFDTYWGKRAGKASTGNASRSSYRSLPSLISTNMVLEPGTKSPEEIIASVEDGILLLEAIDVGGVNVASGDYSVAASGIRIEKGVLTGPVGGVTIAGRLPEMLQNLETVGNDLTWHASVASPTLAISGLTVGG